MVLRSRWTLLCALVCFHFAMEVRAESPADAFRKAAEHYQAGQWQAAAEQFGQFLDSGSAAEPRSSLARFYRGESLVQLQEYDTAMRVFEDFLERAPTHDTNRQRALFQIGVAASATGDLKRAERSLRQFLESDLSDSQSSSQRTAARLRLADVCFRDGQFVEAASLFEQVVEAVPDGEQRWEAGYGWARALELAGNHDDARHQYQSLSATAPVAHADRAILALSLMEFGRERFESCITSLQRLVREFPSSPFVIESHYWQARAHLKLNRNKHDAAAALASLQHATALLLANESPSDQASRLRGAIAQYSSEAATRLRRFAAREASGGRSAQPKTSPVEATATQQAASLFQDQWSQATSQLNSGHPRAAARSYLRIAAQQPGSDKARKAQLSAAKCYEQAGQTHDAIELYARLMKSGDPSIAKVAALRLTVTN